MAENIERAAQNQISNAAGSSRGQNGVIAGILTGNYLRERRDRNRAGRPGANGEPSQAHWENMDAYANREHQRRLDFLQKAQYGDGDGTPGPDGAPARRSGSPEGTFAHNIEYGDRGIKVGYTQRRAEAAAAADKPAAKGRTRQTAGTPPKASTGSKTRGAQAGAAIGGAIGTALGAAAVKNPAGAAVGGEIGAKAGEAIGSAVSNTIAKSKEKKAAASSGSAAGSSSSPKPTQPAGSSYTTDIKFGTTK
jgi:hypothetical protein